MLGTISKENAINDAAAAYINEPTDAHFSALTRACAPYCNRIFTRRHLPKGEWDDCRQEIYLSIFEMLKPEGTFNPEKSNFERYLAGVVNNKVRGVYTREKNRRAFIKNNYLDPESTDMTLESITPDPAGPVDEQAAYNEVVKLAALAIREPGPYGREGTKTNSFLGKLLGSPETMVSSNGRLVCRGQSEDTSRIRAKLGKRVSQSITAQLANYYGYKGTGAPAR